MSECLLRFSNLWVSMFTCRCLEFCNIIVQFWIFLHTPSIKNPALAILSGASKTTRQNNQAASDFLRLNVMPTRPRPIKARVPGSGTAVAVADRVVSPSRITNSDV